LSLLNYRHCDQAEREKLLAKAEQVIRIGSQPIYIFRELMQYLQDQRLVMPGYTFMQDLIGQALTREQDRFVQLAREHLTETDVVALKNLLDNAAGLYEITRLKRELKHFGNQEIAREIKRDQQIEPLYVIAKRLLRVLKISNESIKYYASLIDYYSVFQLSQLDERLVYLYLLCFIYHRYQRYHDNLINGLIYHVRQSTDEAKNVAKERVYAYRIESREHLQKAGLVLKLLTMDTLDRDLPFHAVQTTAFVILDRKQLDQVADELMNNDPIDEIAFQWEHIEGMANRFKRCLRPLLRAIRVDAISAKMPLFVAVQFLIKGLQRRKSLSQYDLNTIPVEFIPDRLKPYLYALDGEGQKRLLVDRYEFLLCRFLRHALEAGNIFCRDSVRFRSFEDDLLTRQQWEKKTALIANSGLPVLKTDFAEHLETLEKTLEERLLAVNQRITSGENHHLQIKKKGQQIRWTLPYPAAPDAVNDPFFDALPQIDIQAVLYFVNQHTQFMEAFDHILPRYAKREADNRAIAACLLAWGTNMGLGRMGTISDLGFQTLATTSNNFLRLETLKKANDQVSNAVAKLSVFQQYMLDDQIHSTSDGQKFETSILTANARYSPKYFGLKKGIVAYTLVANHIPVNARIIGANEHESHYVFDILFNNTSQLHPAIHSTDTHGANEVNFTILHFFGYQFAPRYKALYEKVRTGLYGFKHPNQYDGMLLKPIRKIQKQLILDEADNIQRIMVSLALKTATQNIIVSKLNAYARKNKTRRALWEYDNILRSLYLLDYIDSFSLRRNVQHVLNRGESYHQLRRSVSYANFGKLRFKTEYDQQIWNECSRLMTNCIIYYNASILSNFLAFQQTRGNVEQIDALKSISPVAWQHINFYGRFEFAKSYPVVDLDALIQGLITPSSS